MQVEVDPEVHEAALDAAYADRHADRDVRWLEAQVLGRVVHPAQARWEYLDPFTSGERGEVPDPPRLAVSESRLRALRALRRTGEVRSADAAALAPFLRAVTAAADSVRAATNGLPRRELTPVPDRISQLRVTSVAPLRGPTARPALTHAGAAAP